MGVPRSLTRRFPESLSRWRILTSRQHSVLDADAEPRASTSLATTLAALMMWVALVISAHVWGDGISSLRDTGIFFAPLVARFDPHLHAAIILPVGVAVLAIAFASRLIVRLGWRSLLLAAFIGAALWAVSVALSDGVSELTRPVRIAGDYRLDVPFVGSPAVFLAHFTQRIGRYHQHVRAHPPGMVLLLWAMSRIGLGAPAWEAALEILGGAAMVPAVLIALKETAGERWARSAAPFLAFAPAAVWIATTGDAFFGGVAAWAIAFVILSLRRYDRGGDGLALAGGLLFGAALYLSYGLVLLAAVPLVVAITQRRARPLIVVALGVGLVVLGFALAGFWWLGGLKATIAQYQGSVARLRPQSYFWLGNLATFAVVLGPATAAGLALLRDRRTWFLVAGALAGVAVADAAGLSRAEVERIWLPFAPWVMVAGAALVTWPARGSSSAVRVNVRPSGTGLRGWLTVTLMSGLIIQALLRTAW